MDLHLWKRISPRLRRPVGRRFPVASPTSSASSDGLSAHLISVIETATSHNMVTNRDEQYYARQYAYWIMSELEERFPSVPVRILDLGCGYGRLSLPLAKWCGESGGRVTGVDIAQTALSAARRYAREQRLDNVAFHESDVLNFTRELPDASVDATLLLEVSFILTNFREVLREITRILRPGGVLFLASRSQYYNLLQTIRAQSWDDAKTVIGRREGHLFGGPTFMTWQTPEDVREMLHQLGLRVRSQRGIGVCSGIAGDPLSWVARPSKMGQPEQDCLMQLELSVGAQYAACGRYVLSIAERPGNATQQEDRCFEPR